MESTAPDRSNEWIDASRQPVVRITDTGEAMADSRDVAACFDKKHFHVLDAIRNCRCSDEFRRSNFRSFIINDLTGESTSHVTMTKDGFAFVALGFTGERAATFKERYIAQFNAMEAELRSRPIIDPARLLNDPAALRGMLVTYTEKVLALEEKVSELAPQAQALERIAVASGSLCITDAAKTLQMQPKFLFKWLRSNDWIYRRAGGEQDVAYQTKIAAGVLEHKTTTVRQADGTEKVITQCRVTPKGLSVLAKMLPAAALALEAAKQPPKRDRALYMREYRAKRQVA